MRPEIRFGLSAIEKREIWSRWKAGQSLHEIGRAFDKPHSCIRAVLLPGGGIPPAARRLWEEKRECKVQSQADPKEQHDEPKGASIASLGAVA
jgi:hypothetical protein